jgi:uncharacterized protein YggT (Ycf19 family)
MEKRNYEESDPQLRRMNAWTRLKLIIDYLFFLLYGVIGLIIILEVAGANETSGFKHFLNVVTYPFLSPFSGLFSDLVFRRHHLLRVSYLVSLVVYLLLHFAVLGFFRVFEKHRERV